MVTIRTRRIVAALLVALGLLLAAAPASLELHAHGWDTWTVAPSVNGGD
jgi:hypothetical protein